MREFITANLAFIDAPILLQAFWWEGDRVKRGIGEDVFFLSWRVLVDVEASDWSPVCHASADARNFIAFVNVLAEPPTPTSDISI